MEVHAHSHTERKKFIHYFWEFFMLFLAVTLGFLVENLREHILDRKKERQYIQSLLRDLEKDKASLHSYQDNVDTANKKIDTLIQLLKSAERNLESCKIYNLARTIPLYYGSITPEDETFQQLKSSGSLRLIHNTEIVDRIGSYYRLYVALKDGGPAQMLFQNRHDVYLFNPELFDMLTVDKMFYSDKRFRYFHDLDSCQEKPILLSNDPVIINKVCGRYFYLGMSARAATGWISGMLGKADSLLVTIKKEYHLPEKTPL